MAVRNRRGSRSAIGVAREAGLGVAGNRRSAHHRVADLILAQNQFGRQVLSENTVLIYPNTPAKQKEYRDEIVHTFYLTNAVPKDAESLLKTVLGTKTLFIDERSSTLVMRDTPEHVRMAQKLMASLDVPQPEVIMEVEVIEITHSLMEQLGINYPSSVSLSLTKPPNSAGAGTTTGGAPGLVLSDLAKQNKNTIAISSLGVSVDLLKTVGASNVLSSPRIRARNKEKAKILVGNRLPVVTSGTSATVGGAFSTSNVQYIDVGLKLEVQPTIHNDGDVAIKVAQRIKNRWKMHEEEQEQPTSECMACRATFPPPSRDECPVCGKEDVVRDHSSLPCSFPREESRAGWCRMHRVAHPKQAKAGAGARAAGAWGRRSSGSG